MSDGDSRARPVQSRAAWRKRERERRSVEAYLMRRRRDGTLDWSGRREHLVEGERPDFVVTRSNGLQIGVEVTEAINAPASMAAGYDDEFSVAMREILNSHGGGGFVSMQTGSRPPIEDRVVRRALVEQLTRDIAASGGLQKFIGGLRLGRWEFSWSEAGEDGGRRGRKFVGFEFAPLPDEPRWRLVGGLVAVLNRPTLDHQQVDRLVRERVRDKASKASEYVTHPGGLHVLVVNPFELLVPSKALHDTAADAIRASSVTEVWLLNHDPVVLELEPPEPFIVRLA